MTTSNVTPARQTIFSRRIEATTVSAVREILKVTERPEIISFAGGLPAPELFPKEPMAEAFRGVILEEGEKALQYSTTEGHAPLREWIAARMRARAFGRIMPREVWRSVTSITMAGRTWWSVTMEIPPSSCTIAAARIIGLGLTGCAQATLCAGRAAHGLSLGAEVTFRRTTRVWSSASESRKLRTGSKSSVTNLVRALSAWSNRKAIGIMCSIDGGVDVMPR